MPPIDEPMIFGSAQHNSASTLRCQSFRWL